MDNTFDARPSQFFTLGDIVRVRVTFITKDTLVLVDPTAVSFSFRPTRLGVVTDYAYGVDAELVRESVGVYHVDLNTSVIDGIWEWTYVATGSGAAAITGAFTVLASTLVDTSAIVPGAVTTTGLVTHIGGQNYVARTIVSLSSALVVTNGDGVGGNPSIDISFPSAFNKLRHVPNVSQTLITASGAPVTYAGTNAVAVELPSGADSSVVTWFQVPVDAVNTGSILLVLTFQAASAPGTTNNKVKLKTTATVNGAAASITAGDTITLANNTTPAAYTATLNLIAASSYIPGDFVSVVILRDTTVANNAAVGFRLLTVGFSYLSTQ